jgi:GT2 family glycosyltransferase
VPVATAVVVNFNGAGCVHECVESLLAQDVHGVEVIVVDNASTDGSADTLAHAFGDAIQLLRLPRNTGFGGGNNAALALARAPHVILLNNDAVAAPGFVRALLAAVERDPAVGMVAPKVLDYARRDLIDTVGHLMYWDGLNRGRGRLEEDHGQYDGARTALFPSGAAALYRRAMLDAIGHFDERLFLYGDDAELGMRARIAGWQCAAAPDAIAYHRYSWSAGAHSSAKAFYVERNRLLLLLKLFPLCLVAVSPATTAWRLGLQAVGAVTGRGAAARLADERSLLHLVAVVLRAWASALRLAPGTLRARWAFRRQRRLGTTALLRLLWTWRLPAAELALKD